MDKVYFVKMSGAGNDFIVVDKDRFPDFEPDAGLIQNLCHRKNGIGADGLITIASSNGNRDFEMDYYNADGSTGSLCGNGARCAIRFAETTGRIKEGKVHFYSNKNEYSGEVLGEDLIKFYLNEPKDFEFGFKLNVDDKTFTAAFANTGSPHVVVEVDDIEHFPVFETGRKIRNDKKFSPGGTNVNFIQQDNDKVRIRTYERGVENETLACGTGSVAAALILNRTKNFKSPASLITKGGDELVIDFDFENNLFKNVTLTGPAKIVFSGEFNPGNFS